MGDAPQERPEGAPVIPSSIKCVDCEPRSPEWAGVHIGRVTGSRAPAVFALDIPPELTPTGRPSKAKPKERAARRNLRTQLVLERILNRSLDTDYVSAAMQQGIDREFDALLMYEAITGRLVRHVGFLSHAELMVGGSPDGYLGDFDVIVEAKCPIPATHLEYLETGRVPGDYLIQVTHYLWLTGAQACDWFSYSAEFPESLQVKLVRIERDEKAIAEHEAKVIAFLQEVDLKLSALKTMIDLRGQLEASVA